MPSPHVSVQNLIRARAQFDAAIEAAKQTFAVELAALESRLNQEEDLGSLPRAVVATMNSFNTTCMAACTAFGERTQEATIAIQATEKLNFLS